jgi:hypothetical protein
LNSNLGQFHFVFLLSLFHLENRVCLSRGVQVAGAARRAAMRTVAGVGDLVRRRQVEDGWVNAIGCVGPCYPTFVIFNILGPRGIVVI